MINRTTVLILIAALAAALGLWAGQRWLAARALARPQLQVVKLLDKPRLLPPFSLQQSDGTALVPGELKGQWTLVYLGFTHCPDVCPTTLAQLAQAQNQWATQPGATRPQVLFVSVDPERDTPAQVGDYARRFSRDTLAATGDVAALEKFARSLSLVFMKAPVSAGAPADQYRVDHSTALALLDPQGRMAGVIQPPVDPRAIAADLVALTRASAR